MAGVFVHPPAVAHTDTEVADDAARELTRLARTEDLAMREIVRHERQLGEHDREEARGEQLPPGVAERDERGPADDERDPDRGEPEQVVGRASFQEVSRVDAFTQLGEVGTGSGRLDRHAIESHRGRRRIRWGEVPDHGGVYPTPHCPRRFPPGRVCCVQLSVAPHRARVAAMVAFATNGALAATLLARYAEVKEALGLDAGAFGIVVAGFTLGAAGAFHLPGAILRRFGSRWTTSAGTAWIAVT